VQLTVDGQCLLFGQPERPAVCVSLRPSEEMCGANDGEAMQRLTYLEKLTRPDSSPADPSLPQISELGS
jgi:hypothetical protein